MPRSRKCEFDGMDSEQTHMDSFEHYGLAVDPHFEHTPVYAYMHMPEIDIRIINAQEHKHIPVGFVVGFDLMHFLVFTHVTARMHKPRDIDDARTECDHFMLKRRHG